MLEGVYQKGQSCLLLEDTVTTGASIIETAKLLQDNGIIVTDVCYFIDRKQGGVENLEREGLNATYIFSLDLIIQVLFWKHCITMEQHEQALISLGL